ncbi:MAG: HK97 gp10 family phage protein [Planctomycetia bacterium]
MITLRGQMVGIELIGIDMGTATDSLRDRLKSAIKESADELLAAARSRARVKTGSLRDSIAVEGPNVYGTKQIVARVGTPAFYARFLESGFTPNPRFKSRFDETGKRRSAWKRNPRGKAKWSAWEQRNGPREVFRYAFMKPAIEATRNSIRSRLEAVVGR